MNLMGRDGTFFKKYNGDYVIINKSIVYFGISLLILTKKLDNYC